MILKSGNKTCKQSLIWIQKHWHKVALAMKKSISTLKGAALKTQVLNIIDHIRLFLLGHSQHFWHDSNSSTVVKHCVHYVNDYRYIWLKQIHFAVHWRIWRNCYDVQVVRGSQQNNVISFWWHSPTTCVLLCLTRPQSHSSSDFIQ